MRPTAAHCGSVSAGTFVAAIAFLDSLKVPYESHPVMMMAITESPAIIIGLVLANMARKGDGNGHGKWVSRELVHDAFSNGSVVPPAGASVGCVAKLCRGVERPDDHCLRRVPGRPGD